MESRHMAKAHITHAAREESAQNQLCVQHEEEQLTPKKTLRVLYRADPPIYTLFETSSSRPDCTNNRPSHCTALEPRFFPLNLQMYLQIAISEKLCTAGYVRAEQIDSQKADFGSSRTGKVKDCGKSQSDKMISEQ